MTREIPCVAGPADMWFSDVPADIERARGLCADCPLRRKCLVGALERAETCGVWGGELFRSGFPVPAPKRNGRPPKDAAILEARLHQQMARRIDQVLTSA